MKTCWVILLAAMLAGCATNKSETPLPMRAMGQDVEPGEVPSPEAIGLEVRRLLGRDVPEATGIVVNVDNTTVILTGSVMTVPTAFRAEAAARSVKGVTDVVNQIVVSGTGR
jgi:osmotically-inducible protein OsmY